MRQVGTSQGSSSPLEVPSILSYLVFQNSLLPSLYHLSHAPSSSLTEFSDNYLFLYNVPARVNL
jgi:hypothetical protein